MAKKHFFGSKACKHGQRFKKKIQKQPCVRLLTTLVVA